MAEAGLMHGASGHHPEQADAARRPVAEGDPSQVEYTCPMHPQVRQLVPGACPSTTGASGSSFSRWPSAGKCIVKWRVTACTPAMTPPS
jgi:hypothetical protein